MEVTITPPGKGPSCHALTAMACLAGTALNATARDATSVAPARSAATRAGTTSTAPTTAAVWPAASTAATGGPLPTPGGAPRCCPPMHETESVEMLCTVIWDVYGNDERREIWEATRRLLPEHSRDWSRKGVYGYWDPDTRELLYVGLASNLPERFAQHNRLVTHSGGNKADAIDGWFSSHDRLGLTLLVQAAAVQILDMLFQLSPTLGVESSEISRIAEGQLIELHRLETERWPVWNSVGGSTRGAEWATPRGRSMIRLLSAADRSLFVARRTLRDLVTDKQSSRLEALVHCARMRATPFDSPMGGFSHGSETAK